LTGKNGSGTAKKTSNGNENNQVNQGMSLTRLIQAAVKARAQAEMRIIARQKRWIRTSGQILKKQETNAEFGH
ncbi:hypothetical protein C0Q16_28980, partial [Klebsiella pneumoniae]